MTLEDDMISSLQIILQNGIERVELLELGTIDLNGNTDSTILLANYGVAIIGRAQRTIVSKSTRAVVKSQ